MVVELRLRLHAVCHGGNTEGVDLVANGSCHEMLPLQIRERGEGFSIFGAIGILHNILDCAVSLFTNECVPSVFRSIVPQRCLVWLRVFSRPSFNASAILGLRKSSSFN